MDATGNAGSGSASSHGDTVSSVAIEFLANKRHSNDIDARSDGTVYRQCVGLVLYKYCI